ncbi:MAG: DNA methyltransferase [Novosphingobium sp.]
MRLGWDEIKRRAKAFSEEWKDAHYEKGETHSFYNDFFEIFGIKRRQVAVYEKQVQALDKNRRGFIDLFWPGTLIVEQKSAGRDLLAAQMQASEYFNWLPPRDQPRFILTCDFQRWNLIDLDDNGRELSFHLKDLHKHITAFDFMLGRKVSFETQAAVTIKAAELMGKLHDALEASGYTGHDLEQLLVRLLFCLFADNTGIFQPKDIFLQLLENDTKTDGSDTGNVLSELFDILDTPEGQRLAGTSAELDAFPYVNGALFRGRLRIPKFDGAMRELLLDACRHDWSGVSPAIFGSLFQSVMSPKERRAKGAHYTTEANILKVIGPLFLDDLKAELASIIARRTGRDKALAQFQDKLTRLTFFDPACGCGNFLVIAYREIRRLELECLKAQYGDQAIDAALLSRVTVDQFYGIEYEEFPARIAEVAMWMMDHIANNELNEAFRLNYARIPLKDSAHILHGDALEADWSALLPPDRCHFIMGNPPFVGAKFQSELQRAQVRRIAGLGGSGGTLDYVAAWFIKAGQFVAANPRIRVAFVATNSICQGEQVAQLWPILFDRFGLEIAFAHRTFSWGSEARGKAHVHVVIVGLAHRDHEPAEKRLFSYPDIKGDPVESRHGALTAYLFDARGVANRHLVVKEESRPINGARRVKSGVQMIDNRILTFTYTEMADFLAKEPEAKPLFRQFLGGDEYINGFSRWILYLADADPAFLRTLPLVTDRMQKLKAYRASSSRASTKAMADYPTKLGVDERLTSDYLVIPNTSSERRDYVPIGWLSPQSIASQKLRILADASLWEFGVLTSRCHMAWLGYVGGRLKSDFSYTHGLVYNTFPWPDATPAQRARIEALAQAVLDARAAHPTASLADLYDPDTMPANLRKAHTALDTAVDRLYRAAPFASDRDRVEHLFGRYEALVNPLQTIGAAKNRRVAKRAKPRPAP